MPEPFKNFIGAELIAAMAQHLSDVWSGFPADDFIIESQKGLATLELKQRADQIARVLQKSLPQDFPAAAAILHAALPGPGKAGLSGWAILPLNIYIARCGLVHFDHAMALLRDATKHFTSEFGVRAFLIEDQDRALAYMMAWSESENVHIRRLATEGCRPRLPWAMQLPEVIKDPSPILPILTRLRDDPENYVRRSVANNLNDISKDHPDLVAGIAEDWMKGASRARERLIRHACRTLLKQGHKRTLRTFGFAEPKAVAAALNIQKRQLVLGESLEFELALNSSATRSQNLMIDYAVHHRKANGSLSPKVFKWKSSVLDAGARLTINRKHAVRPITTRKYYAGEHRLEVIVNGVSIAEASFDLTV